MADLQRCSKGLSPSCGHALLSGTVSPVTWAWVSPLLSVGTVADAQQLGDVYSEEPLEVAHRMRLDRQAMVVPTREMAAKVLRILGHDESWVRDHVLLGRTFGDHARAAQT